MPLGTPSIIATRTADESGSGVVSAQGTTGSLVALDTARCQATAVTTLP